MNLSIQIIKNWGVKGGLAILDQGLFSGSNFVLNILLARWLDVSYYGAYSIGFALFLFITGIYNSLILEPMAVLGPSNYEYQKGEYIKSQFKLHILVTFLTGFPLVLIGRILSKNSGSAGLIGEAIWGTGLFLPLIMLNWLVRRIFYVLRTPLRSLVSSTVYTVSLLGGSFVVREWLTEPDLASWFGLLGMAGMLSGAIPILLWRHSIKVKNAVSDLTAMDVLAEHWRFGRWIMIATIFHFAAVQIQLFSVGLMLDLNAAGVWRAIQNFILPMMQVITAIATLSLPTMAFDFGKDNFRTLKRKGIMVTLVLLLLAAAYELFLFIFSRCLNELFYENKFVAFTALIPLLGIVPLLAAAETGFSLVLRTLQRPIYYLIYTITMAVSGFLFGPLLIWLFGLTGAGISQVIVGVCSLLVNIYLYRVWFSKAKMTNVLA